MRIEIDLSRIAERVVTLVTEDEAESALEGSPVEVNTIEELRRELATMRVQRDEARTRVRYLEQMLTGVALS